ncbi:4'-phosphopantetheinyl transferase family protein [Bacillus cereus group sp. TH152-1LC]|uniref:4'-phosphopantetheinyl transferase family protein n=1 Tax=Bacillus cereus group sp. TH152-1LC TaxID=3018060 RepID=UPI0022E83856|nr:4'-phosphopantetheinyl transferase superfamily protein [Bacillus cereus group sp. TH152-1LC]MDA1677498.1 4'-phosphopantetheinyl transferase superfamily protein [Bacillus cereus group sp. TH152-1LC]
MSKTQKNTMEIFAINNSKKLDTVIIKKLLNVLSPQEQLRYKRFLRWRDAQNNLLGHIVVRSLISIRFNIPIEKILISLNNYGKPYCDSIKEFHFNISHSNEWVVVVVNNDFVGIDIEEINTADLEIAKHFFSKEEYVALAQKSLEEKKSYFYDLWTLKESYIKADGRGLNIPLNSFSIIKDKFGIRLTRAQKKYYFKQYNIDKRYKLSVCSRTDGFPDKVNIIENDVLIQNFLKI